MSQYLTFKQSKQLIRLCEKTQSYLPFKETTFIILIETVAPFVREIKWHRDKTIQIEILKSSISEINNRHYAYGFKLNKYKKFNHVFFKCPRMNHFEGDFTEIEKIAFIKTIRTCRDFLYSNLSNENEFIDRLIKISVLLD